MQCFIKPKTIEILNKGKVFNMENLIKNYYENLKTPTLLFENSKLLWQNKSAQNCIKNKRFIKKVLELKFEDSEIRQNFIFDAKEYVAVIRPFEKLFVVEITEETNSAANLMKRFYDRLKTPVFLCRGSNLVWQNVSATDYFSNVKLKQNILKFKDCEKEEVKSFICNDEYFKVVVRPFEDFYYVEILEKQPAGFSVVKDQNRSTNDLLETEILDTIARSVVHDISQALSQISEILEKNNNLYGLEFVDIISKRMYSFIRATNLCYEYELLLQERNNMNTEIVDIFVEIDALCTAIKSLIGKSQVSFEWEVPKEKVFCDIDMHKLGFALFHLICNSYRFSTPGGKIKVTAKMDEFNYVKIEVCDTGIGITEEIKEKVLKPFFSHDSFTGDIAGVGLGLTYVGLFADKVDGSVEISSTDEGGTRVLLSMPIVSLSDVMGLSSHIINYMEGKYDNMVSTLVGSLHDRKIQDRKLKGQKLKI